ncbi:hypothetical protein LTR70_001078 [Exophiala xenobiotica]|uniref:NACHT domain-containing protein n=1 Tax=Lithohypha guttulata TaxID=1690604 RepID=A0ABR0KMS8_9EURO|nr:hypothetical protein LTR24_000733 [Lithohypha guttulata]KAK5328924.1 hypothetical protein LTR70_001078 [Exophiala xenobiotica]
MDEADSSHHPLASGDDCDAPELSAATSPGQVFAGHSYPAINISGQAQVQLGDKHYHSGTPDQSQRLASSLHFPEIHRRYESIEDAHSDTFDWIFEPPDRQQPPWSSFVDWLTNEQSLYWVSGKPGSGKSTLMKHVVETIQQQHQEDPQQAPIVLSFWFWEAGSKLEHSLIGCMRSLLWQLLQDTRSCHAVVQSAQRSAQTPWTTRRLKDILFKALQRLSSGPVLLFLDGLDEAGADADDVLACIQEMIGVSAAGLKICVSSRPEQAYINAFSSHPHLRVQDLNYEDIRAIIAQDLLGNPSITKLAQHNDDSSLDRLTLSIQERAHGVLLWVRLVVRSLLRGIQNLDDIDTLQHRLDETPGDLEELYEQVLHRNNHDHKHYSAEAAFYFQFLLHRRGDLDIIQYCLAIDDNLRTWCMNPETGWDPSELRAKFDCEKIRTWISVRTGGLLEVCGKESYSQPAGDQNDSNHGSTFKSWYKNYSGWRVRFIHRTARTFVSETSTGKNLLSASRRSSAELVRVCFECCFIVDEIFSALAGDSGNRERRFDALVRSCFDDTVRQSLCVMPPQSIEGYERAYNGLLAKGYLLLNDFPLPERLDLQHRRQSLPTFDGRTIDFCRLYCEYGLWEYVQHDLASRCNHADYLSILLACTAVGLHFCSQDVPRREAGAALFVRLIEIGADPRRQVTFYNGESTWVLPIIARCISMWSPVDMIRAILRCDLSYPMENLPLISVCNDMWWSRGRELRCLWGDYRISNMKGLIESQDPEMRHSLDLGSSRVYVCCEVDIDNELSLFAVSFERSRKLLNFRMADAARRLFVLAYES